MLNIKYRSGGGDQHVTITQWLAKSVYEAAVTSVTHNVLNFLKHHEGLHVNDHDTQFNPLFMKIRVII
jgi:hypothetical protein